MLPKKTRLNSSLIPKISKFGKRYSTESFEVRVWYDNLLLESHFGISISTKIDKRAVIRNKIKRKLRAVIQLIINNKIKINLANYLIIVRSVKLFSMNNEEIYNEIIKIIKY